MKEIYSVSALLQMGDWDGNILEYPIADDIFICKTEGSNVGNLYNTLCLDTGIDYGEPFWFPLFIRFDMEDNSLFIDDFGSPYNIVDRVINLLVIAGSYSIGLSRVIMSKDNYKSCHSTFLLYRSGEQTDFLQLRLPSINNDVRSFVKNSWNNIANATESIFGEGRIFNSLLYFYYAWRSHYLDQTTIHLAISIETLFSPHSQNEISHQIAFHVAKFIGNDSVQKKKVYSTIKSFYNIRSQIVHGARPNQDKLCDITVETFHICTEVLRKILLNIDFIKIFDNNKTRIEYLDNNIFH